MPAEEENLPNLAANVLVRALFAGSEANDSPALNFKDVNLIGYLNGTSGAYVTRENELTQGVASTKVYVQMHIPSGTSVDWRSWGGSPVAELVEEVVRQILAAVVHP